MEEPRRVAIMHEWLTSMRGGEKCVEALFEIFPTATLFTLVHSPGSVSRAIEERTIHTSFVQRLPLAKTHYRYYLPLFPRAVERFDLRGFDLVISSHHCVAKGVRVPPGSLHICYCYTPMRYIWSLYEEYFGKQRAGMVTRMGMTLFLGYLRRWDVRTAQNPHYFVAISEHVRRRIRQIYERGSDVIYPPVDTSRFHVSDKSDGYFLIVSALVPYKRVDLAVEAFTKIGEKLVIVGDGPERRRLQRFSAPNIEFAGWCSDEEVRKYYAGCKAVVFPGEEDFGIVPVEAMASGKPVIAFAKGGVLETVVDRGELKTGVLFDRQTVESVVDAVRSFKEEEFVGGRLREHALRYDKEVFKKRMREYIKRKWEEFKGLRG